MPRPTPTKTDPREAAKNAEDQIVEMDASGDEDMPDGDYAMKLIEFNTEAKSKAGDPQWELTLYVPDANGGKGGKMKVWLSHKEAARWKLTQTMKALGVVPVEGKFRFKTAELLGQWVLGKVKNEEYNDETRPKVTGIKPAGPELIKKYAGKPSA